MRKVLLVVGGARGIGAAVSVLAAARGYDVAITYRERAERASGVLERVRRGGARGLSLALDVRDSGALAGAFERVQAELGGIDGVVISAGITGRASKLVDASDETLRETVDTNLTGSILCAREAARVMARSRGGRGGALVLLSSGAATLGSPGEFVWYAATKGGIDALTIGLSKELASEGIRVNAVAPGLTDTELHALSTGEPGRVARMAPSIPLGRGARVEEVAEPVLWLLSDAASYVTGAILRVAGGR